MSKMKSMRRHANAPANWQFRPRGDGSGRPRWIPSPTLRKAGWKARDLKDAAGVFLSEGLSRDAARAINQQVEAWRRGDAIEPAYADIAPAGAAVLGGAPALPQATDRLSIGRLLDAYYDSPQFQGLTDARSVTAGGLKPSTQRGYRNALKRMVDTLAGFVVLPDPEDRAAVAANDLAVARVRASRVHILQPTETARGMVNLLYTAYQALYARAGQHQAYAVLAAASAWLKWCQRHQSDTIRRSWASEVSRVTPQGRVRPLTWDEVAALITAADAMDLRSIGDAIVLGVDLSWSQADRLALTWDRLKDGRAFTGREGRQKTGRVGGTPLTAMGRARVAAIVARQATFDAKPTHVLWCELTGAPWSGDLYRKAFARVRAAAAVDCPSLLMGPANDPAKGAGDADLRDTAFTWMKNAGLSDDGIASRTLQGRQHIAQLGDQAYGEVGPAIADPAMREYEAYLRKIGAVTA